MNEPSRTLRLHRDTFLPLLLVAREAGVSVEEVVRTALIRFGSLPLEERITLLREHRLQASYPTTKARWRQEAQSRYQSMIDGARGFLRWLLRRGGSG